MIYRRRRVERCWGMICSDGKDAISMRDLPRRPASSVGEAVSGRLWMFAAAGDSDFGDANKRRVDSPL